VTCTTRPPPPRVSGCAELSEKSIGQSLVLMRITRPRDIERRLHGRTRREPGTVQTSVVWVKSSYHGPIAKNDSGIATQITRSAIRLIRSQPNGDGYLNAMVPVSNFRGWWEILRGLPAYKTDRSSLNFSIR
jgi:hypothetical protein